jgi:hypothetical protein
LFCQLDAVPLRNRENNEFRDRDRELARMLGLEDEWLFSVVSVTDRRRPVPSPRPAEHDRVRVYAVRFELLAAAKESAKGTHNVYLSFDLGCGSR